MITSLVLMASLSAAPAPEHFGAEVATEAYLAQMTSEARARSDAYYEGGYWMDVVETLLAISIALALLQTGLAARARDRLERVTRFKWLQTAIFVAGYFVLATLLTFPWTLYREFFREHQYGLSNQTFPQWLGDQAKELAVLLVLGTLALVAIYAVVRRARRWWLWGACVAVAFVLFANTLAPVYISPLFNTYTSLPESPLKAQILSLARANGIPAHDVYWFDASKQSKRVSANVSGMFGTTRISMNDNLMNRSSPEAIRAVLGHEMGHYVLNHAYKGVFVLAVLIVIGFALFRWAFERLRTRFGERWRIRDAGDVAGLPLFAALVVAFGFILTPVGNSMTRSFEAEADMFGLNAAREPDGQAQAALQLSEYRKMRPGRLEEILFFDHPSGWNRIHRAMIWKAEHLADSPVR
jgi:STE24 endopeptidase